MRPHVDDVAQEDTVHTGQNASMDRRQLVLLPGDDLQLIQDEQHTTHGLRGGLAVVEWDDSCPQSQSQSRIVKAKDASVPDNAPTPMPAMKRPIVIWATE